MLSLATFDLGHAEEWSWISNNNQFDSPKLSSKRWQIWYGGDINGDGALQAAVFDSRGKILLMTERRSCRPKVVEFVVAA